MAPPVAIADADDAQVELIMMIRRGESKEKLCSLTLGEFDRRRQSIHQRLGFFVPLKGAADVAGFR